MRWRFISLPTRCNKHLSKSHFKTKVKAEVALICASYLAGCSSLYGSVRDKLLQTFQQTEHQMAQVVLVFVCLQKSIKKASLSSSTVVENQWVCQTFNCLTKNLQQSKSVTSKSHLINDLPFTVISKPKGCAKLKII